MDCIFCKIVNKEINAKTIYENQELLAFHDIHPKAPTHVLLIPKEHIATVNDLTTDKAELVGNLILKAKELAAELGLQGGYRLVFNCNSGGGQEVYHLHLHLLGGRQMSWPPG